MALFETMMDETGTVAEKAATAEAAEKWASTYGAFAADVQALEPDQIETRQHTLVAVSADLKIEMAHAARASRLSETQFGDWFVATWPQDIEDMPHIGRLFEVTYERFRNREDVWKPNDLFAMQCLCLAAGYADVVVTERKMAALLNRAGRRLTAAAFVCPSSPAAVEHVRDLLAGTGRSDPVDLP